MQSVPTNAELESPMRYILLCRPVRMVVSSVDWLLGMPHGENLAAILHHLFHSAQGVCRKPGCHSSPFVPQCTRGVHAAIAAGSMELYTTACRKSVLVTRTVADSSLEALIFAWTYRSCVDCVIWLGFMRVHSVNSEWISVKRSEAFCWLLANTLAFLAKHMEWKDRIWCHHDDAGHFRACWIGYYLFGIDLQACSVLRFWMVAVTESNWASLQPGF